MSPGQFLNRFKIFILYMLQEKQKKMARKIKENVLGTGKVAFKFKFFQ